MKSKKAQEHSFIHNSHALTLSDPNQMLELKVEDDIQNNYGLPIP